MLLLSDRLEDLAPATSALLGLLFPLRYVVCINMYHGAFCYVGVFVMARVSVQGSFSSLRVDCFLMPMPGCFSG